MRREPYRSSERERGARQYHGGPGAGEIAGGDCPRHRLSLSDPSWKNRRGIHKSLACRMRRGQSLHRLEGGGSIGDRWMATILRTALVGLFLWMVRGFLVPIAMSGLLALLLSPLHEKLKARLGKGSRYSSLIITVLVLLLVVLPFVLLTIQAVSSIN